MVHVGTGHGAVFADDALDSTRHRPILILLGQIQPFHRAEDGVGLNGMNLDELPRRAAELLAWGKRLTG